MLRLRIVTATILIPLIVAVVLFLPWVHLKLILAGVMALAAWEWARLSGVQSWSLALGFIALTLLGGAGTEFWLLHNPAKQSLIPLLAFLWWSAIAVFISIQRLPEQRQPGISASVLVAGFVTLILTYLTLGRLHADMPQGPQWVLVCLLLVWAADIGAYFAGKRFGRVRLAPGISPGKTLEGLVGGLVSAIIIALLAINLLHLSGLQVIRFILLSLLVALFSVIGDLFESWLKRRAGLKDSGTLLPGHGGVLDRIDSLLAAIPVFLYGLLTWL